MRPSKIVLIVLFVIYIALGAGALAVLATRGYYDVINKTSFHFHGFLSLLGTFMLGCALLIFRLLAGTPTRNSKYGHMAACIAAFFIILIGIIWADISRWEYFSDMHIVPGYILTAAFALQITWSSLLLTFLYSRRQVRSKVAFLHNILGLAIYIFLLACCLSGAQYHQKAVYYALIEPTTTEPSTSTEWLTTRVTRPPTRPRRTTTKTTESTPPRYVVWETLENRADGDFGEAQQIKELRGYNILLYLQFTIVVFSVLSPYFEWELVYPI